MSIMPVQQTTQVKPSISKRKLASSRHVFRVVADTFRSVNLQPEVIVRAVLVKTSQMEILFIVLNTHKIEGRLSAYTSKDLLHKISTNLQGKPVAISNSTGYRLAVLMSSPPDLPRKVELPEPQLGKLLIGVRANGTQVAVPWDALGNLLVAGMTRSGKSTFLRSLVYQAIADGSRLLLGDLPQTTFPMLEAHESLLLPIAEDVSAYPGLVARALAICNERRGLFRQSPEYPEKLLEYNAWAVRNGREPLPRVLVILDEYNAAALRLGSGFTDAVSSLAAQGLKFGMHLVLAAQMFDKKTLGNVRDQFGAVIAFKVKSSTVARNVGVAKAERIPSSRQGLAITDRWGLVQTFYLSKERLIELGQGRHIALLSDQERQLMQIAWEREQGKVSIPKLVVWAVEMGWGDAWSKHKTSQRARQWKLRGWVRKDPRQDNARYITPEFAKKIGLGTETRKPQKPVETPETNQKPIS